MFALARGIIRHKVGFVAVAAFAIFVFSNNQSSQEVERSNNSPWAKQAAVQPAQASAADEDSITGKLGAVANQAGELAAEKLLGNKDLNPVALGDQAVSNFDNANKSFAKANGSN